MNSVKAFAPATVANVSCGFDIFGFAIQEPGDTVELTKRDEPGVVITEITGDEGRLPRQAEKNSVTVVMLALLKHLGIKDLGCEVVLRKNMPLGSGMGSSAASAVAGVVAMNELLGNPLSRKELLPFAMEGERIASGSAHADNVGPSLLGGFVVIRSYNPLDIFTIPVPDDLYCTLVHPDIEINTKDARFILRNEVSLKNTIAQMGNVAGLVAGLMKADYDLISRSMVDVIIEPVRSILIPEFKDVKQAAISNGALGCSISGAGPSMFALSRGIENAQNAGKAMQERFASAGIESAVHVSGINQGGAVILQ
ncbi:homoserine kinase [Dyadobacter sp. BE34]|uniref:Homoserine kinase n=1 Tax=Dyadobacter fermentans TaxID=94254 RepID=A0ABU1R4K9_9BACT|nr:MULTISPECIES: homoserine kinase [Dyadobacter]MDR6808339.1 homoserine kinase [Dyadobacter fermentans]MDR7045844.1 homoserine kinase [Dyadobacter sp. BE242]MDR7200157.1 homoserine kinase [Dyadobacter sp. BE34]MDR7218117.1 homoserine kinase [Dyadobacter sp. BE31]MDR7266048.1 homoserine kinase [Dyadobacter sp. BE32]